MGNIVVNSVNLVKMIEFGDKNRPFDGFEPTSSPEVVK